MNERQRRRAERLLGAYGPLDLDRMLGFDACDAVALARLVDLSAKTKRAAPVQIYYAAAYNALVKGLSLPRAGAVLRALTGGGDYGVEPPLFSGFETFFLQNLLAVREAILDFVRI